MSEKITMDVLERGTDRTCGEGCGRRARIEFGAGGLIYCEHCLYHLASLGSQFADAIDAAVDDLKQMGRTR
jgi:hypothetical protein